MKNISFLNAQDIKEVLRGVERGLDFIRVTAKEFDLKTDLSPDFLWTIRVTV